MFKQIYCFSWVLIIGVCFTICWILNSTFFIFCSNKNISFWKAVLNIWLILKVIFYQKLRNMQQKYAFKAKYVQICNKNMHLKPKYAKICIYSKICKNMHLQIDAILTQILWFAKIYWFPCSKTYRKKHAFAWTSGPWWWHNHNDITGTIANQNAFGFYGMALWYGYGSNNQIHCSP